MLADSTAKIHFTHLSKASRDSLASVFVPQPELADANCHQAGVLELIREQLGEGSSSLQKVCLLDPKAELPLSPDDGDGRFEWFLFGVSLATSISIRLLLLIGFCRRGFLVRHKLRHGLHI
jgi:hypothetical protein